MTDTPVSCFLVYLPLWGATFDSEAVGWFRPWVSAYVPHLDEWRQIQKHDLWMKRWLEGGAGLEGPKPPLCVTAGPPIAPGTDPTTLMEEESERVLGEARGGVLALRLLKGGWFLDPELAEVIWSDGSMNHRRPGPYRQAFLGGEVPLGLPGYELSIRELSEKLDRETELTRLFDLLQRYDSHAVNPAVGVALENFQRSYGWHLSWSERAAFLFTCLDAMLGGMSARRIGKTKLRARFLPRIGVALAALEADGVFHDAEGSARWLDRRGRRLRNAVAHGRGEDASGDAEECYDRLQGICRTLLRQFLEFALRWAEDRAGVMASVDLSERASMVAAYNRLLEIQAHGGDAPDLLSLRVALPVPGDPNVGRV